MKTLVISSKTISYLLALIGLGLIISYLPIPTREFTGIALLVIAVLIA